MCLCRWDWKKGSFEKKTRTGLYLIWFFVGLFQSKMTVLYLISSLFPFEDKQKYHSLLKSRCFACLDWQVLSITGFFPEWRDVFKFLSGNMKPT